MRSPLSCFRPSLAALLAAVLLIGPPAPAAADDDGLRLPPTGHTLLNLTASERMTLPQDLLGASLRVESRSADPRKVQDDINKAMTAALALTKAVAAVKTTSDMTRGFSSWT